MQLKLKLLANHNIMLVRKLKGYEYVVAYKYHATILIPKATKTSNFCIIYMGKNYQPLHFITMKVSCLCVIHILLHVTKLTIFFWNSNNFYPAFSS